MKILSVAGESVPPSKGGSPADTFERSMASYEKEGQQKNITVTYVRYFEKVLAEKGIYDQEAEGVPVNRLAAVLYLEHHGETRENRHYINDTEDFLKLFSGFSLSKWKEKYPGLSLA
ncbi:hypothetical protein [Brevibacillus borstelensis]|uniref:hypothetical protein n=1 Tax=Brevibacillus borstelensis TaxID=45462 RepID=UPI0030C44AFB